MIISHKHKFIFVKTAKTAGSSVESWLVPALGPEDEIISPGKNETPSGTLYYHAPAKLIKRLRPREWEEYLTWAIVRDPLDRLVSAYFHRKARDGENYLSFSEWLRSAKKGHLTSDLLRPRPKKLLFFEELPHCLAELDLDLDPSDLPHLKGDTRPKGVDVVSEDDIRFFKENYQREFLFHKNLGYSVERN